MIIVTKLNRNGGQLSELDGTEWLYPPGAPSTGRAPKRQNGHRELNLFKHPMEITKV